jgi:prephenate dehydrogenase
MAGSETTGVESSNPDLFVNATYVLTPTQHTNPDSLAAMQSLVEGIGARVITMDPDSHDRCAAVISHLPHLIAAALVAVAQEYSGTNPQIFDLIAGSFRDMTRVASSSPVLWRDICLTNSDAICACADAFHRTLKEGVKLVESKDSEAFEDWFKTSKEIRDSLGGDKNKET